MAEQNTAKVLGVWFGFRGPEVIKREGIGRYAYYLTQAIVKETDLNIEIWCYFINYRVFEELFEPLVQTGRVSVKTEISQTSVAASLSEASPSCKYSNFENELFQAQKSADMAKLAAIWKDKKNSWAFENLKQNMIRHKLLMVMIFLLGNYAVWTALDVGVWLSFFAPTLLLLAYLNRNIFARVDKNEGDKLAEIASRVSSAEVFLVPYVGLTNSYYLKQKKVVAVHDLVTIQFAEEFGAETGGLKQLLVRNCELLYSLGRLAQQGNKFVCHSEFVFREHCLKLIPEIKNDKLAKIFLPVNMPSFPNSSAESLQKKGITNDFIFYPTQHRPYKNIKLLVQATRLLNDSGNKIDLVLTATQFTGDLKGFLEQGGHLKYVKIVGDLSEEELMSFHQHAHCVVAPSKFEGGMPWPALEAIWVGTPVIMGDIPQTRERLEFAGVKDFEKFGVLLFDVNDVNDLFFKLTALLRSREEYKVKQSALKNLLFNYSWSDAAKHYLKWMSI